MWTPPHGKKQIDRLDVGDEQSSLRVSVGVALACGIFLLVKRLSSERVVLDCFTAEGIVVGIFAVGCFIAAYMNGDFLVQLHNISAQRRWPTAASGLQR